MTMSLCQPTHLRLAQQLIDLYRAERLGGVFKIITTLFTLNPANDIHIRGIYNYISY